MEWVGEAKCAHTRMRMRAHMRVGEAKCTHAYAHESTHTGG